MTHLMQAFPPPAKSTQVPLLLIKSRTDSVPNLPQFGAEIDIRQLTHIL